MLYAIKATAAALALVVTAAPVVAADLGGYKGGSIKDGYVPAGPAYSAAGPCYVRSDVGYSWSNKPNAHFIGNNDPTVTKESLDDGALWEAGIGCSMGSRGIRAEMVLGTREEKKFKGDFIEFFPNRAPVDPTLFANIKTHTMMFNAYKDLGRHGGFVPYIGFGVGFAWHNIPEVTSNSVGAQVCGGCAIIGEDKVSFAWALMAGVGYQVSDRAILDVGYRYMDMGRARSGHGDTARFWNPRLEIDDIRAHELKVGMRYHFGTAGEPAPAYAPMK